MIYLFYATSGSEELEKDLQEISKKDPSDFSKTPKDSSEKHPIKKNKKNTKIVYEDDNEDYNDEIVIDNRSNDYDDEIVIDNRSRSNYYDDEIVIDNRSRSNKPKKITYYKKPKSEIYTSEPLNFNEIAISFLLVIGVFTIITLAIYNTKKNKNYIPKKKVIHRDSTVE